ncbi:MAG: protein translocase subunit SecF [Candidatus Bruticola sp.]
MGALNVTTSDVISLAIWCAILVITIIWGQSFRRHTRNIIGHRKYYYITSVVVLVFCFVGIFGKKLNFGLDFTGGTILELGAPKIVEMAPDKIADIVKAQHPGYDVTVQVGNGLTTSGDGKSYQKILVRVRSDASTEEMGLSSEQAVEVRAELEKGINVGPLENISETTIGPTISSELKSGAFKALFIACLLQLIYITFRFGNQLRFGFSAVVAVIHDAIVMVGFYAWAGLPVDSSFVAALLTITSYSLMDTVVVFDRIREHQHNEVNSSFEELTNRSVCETMVRSINTSLTTIVVCICLYFMGGESLKGFAYALLVGVITGAYSSIFLSAPLIVDCNDYANKRDLLRQDELRKEAEEKAKSQSNVKSSGRRPVARPRPVAPAPAAESEGSVPDTPAGPVTYASARPRRRVKGMRKK